MFPLCDEGHVFYVMIKKDLERGDSSDKKGGKSLLF